MREQIRLRRKKSLEDIDRLIKRFVPFVTGSAVAQQVMVQLNSIKTEFSNLSEEEDEYIGKLEDEIRALKTRLGIKDEEE